jgi:ArsR family transcriptional regulator
MRLLWKGGACFTRLRLISFLRALSHPERVLELLADGELTVGELQTLLAADSGVASHHLSTLRSQGLVEGPKQGTSVLHRIIDARTTEVLALARQLIRTRLTEGQELVAELTAEDRSGPA